MSGIEIFNNTFEKFILYITARDGEYVKPITMRIQHVLDPLYGSADAEFSLESDSLHGNSCHSRRDNRHNGIVPAQIAKCVPDAFQSESHCGVLAGLAFVGIIIYFIPNVIIPLATAGEFRTWIDVVAIFSYILAGIPMILLALLNLKLLFRKVIEQKRTTYAILLLAAFLVLSHIAMIFGMVDPGIAGYKPKAKSFSEVQAPTHHMDSMHEGHHHH